MIKEFIVSRIEASHDGTPYVQVSFMDTTSGERQQSMNPFGVKAMTFSSPEDLMKNLPKAMGDISKMISGGMGGGGGMTGDSPTFKISMKDYEDMNIKVGDKVTIEIKKSDAGSIYT
jgi:hypothetical protein